MQLVRKTIHYKTAQLSGDVELQSLLNTSLAVTGSAAKPINRQQRINADEDSVIFLNRLTEYSGMLFGQLIFL